MRRALRLPRSLPKRVRRAPLPPNGGALTDALFAAGASQMASGDDVASEPIPRGLEEAYQVRYPPLLGCGKYSKVWLADHLPTGERHAVKSVRAEFRESFVRETEALKRLSHPNVAKLLRSFPGEAGTSSAFSLPVADVDLRVFLFRRCGRVDAVLARNLAVQLARGLEHVHGKYVVHGDVRPRNILLSLQGFGDLRLVLADFGSARIAKRWMVSDKGSPGEFAGTAPEPQPIAYAAPELVFVPAGSSTYGRAVDVWSFGAVAFELVVCEPLALGTGAKEVVAAWVAFVGPPDLCNAQYASVDNMMFWELLRAAESSTTSTPPRVPDVSAEAVIRAAFTYVPSKRPSMAALLHFDWLANARLVVPAAPAGSRGVSAPAGSQRRVRQGGFAKAGSPTRGTAAALPGFLRPVSCAPLPVSIVSGGCSCTGHCYTAGHAYRGGCESKTVANGSRYCPLCKCSIACCPSPRYRSSLCKAHGRILQKSSITVQLTRASRHCVHALLPCDVVDYVSRYAVFRGDPALTVIVAMLQEPVATGILCAQIPQLGASTYSAEELADRLQAVALACNQNHAAEQRRLHRQGPTTSAGDDDDDDSGDS